ncbi:MAG TPA: hypothetical protein VMO17_19755 [Terriglobia bacterium]|nr:hypothetical protein [Terriglobia bacterium]
MAPNSTPPANGALDKGELKAQGLAFGQAFQTVFKISAMYSVDHPAAGRSIQQSWALLNPLLQRGPQFTFGFMNQRLLLNTSLVSHTNLTHLEVEFSRREIATVTLSSGLTLRDYKRALALLTTRPMVIMERGGIKKFLEENPVEGVRVRPAAKPTEDGDTIEMGMDFESYLTAQALLGGEGGTNALAVDELLGAAGIKKPEGHGGSPRELLDVADAATRNTVADPEGDVAQLLTALTQMLSGWQPETLRACLPPESAADLQDKPPDVISVHLMEDSVAAWAAERLRAAAQAGDFGAGPGGGGGTVEREVLGALLRGLKATRVAERLLLKLSQFVEQAHLPKEVYERIRRDVLWFSLPADKKQAQLLSQGVPSPQDFARLVQWVQEAMADGRVSEACDVARHYFSTWEKAPFAVRAEEMKRAPELLRALAGLQTLPLMHALAEPFMREILDETRLHWPCHLEANRCLAVVAQNAGRFEDFEFVQKIAAGLKRSLARRPDQHAECCGHALADLLSTEALDRLVESFLHRRSDALWVRNAGTLLTMIGPPGAEAALRRLEGEHMASNRLPLIRLIRGMGASAIDSTRKRLSDPRWYVVRNAAYILGDLGDPELPTQLRGALRHPDLRVQQAAMTGILKCGIAGRGEVLAEALPYLQPGVLEMALDELTVLKDPASVEHLERLLVGAKGLRAGVLEKAVIALGALRSDRAANALFGIIMDTEQPLLVRRAALGGLFNHRSALAPGLVEKLSGLPPTDALARELKSAS